MAAAGKNLELIVNFRDARCNADRFALLLDRYGLGGDLSAYRITREGNTFSVENRDGSESRLAFYVGAREDFDFKDPNLRPAESKQVPTPIRQQLYRNWKQLASMGEMCMQLASQLLAITDPKQDCELHRFVDRESHAVHFIVGKMVLTIAARRLPAYDIPSSTLFEYLDVHYPRKVSDDDIVSVFTQDARIVISVNDHVVRTQLRPSQFLLYAGA